MSTDIQAAAIVPPPLVPSTEGEAQQFIPSLELQTKLNDFLYLYNIDVTDGKKEDSDAPYRIALNQYLNEERDKFMQIKEIYIPREINDFRLNELDLDADHIEEEILTLKDLDLRMQETLDQSHEFQQNGGRGKYKSKRRRKSKKQRKSKKKQKKKQKAGSKKRRKNKKNNRKRTKKKKGV